MDTNIKVTRYALKTLIRSRSPQASPTGRMALETRVVVAVATLATNLVVTEVTKVIMETKVTKAIMEIKGIKDTRATRITKGTRDTEVIRDIKAIRVKKDKIRIRQVRVTR